MRPQGVAPPSLNAAKVGLRPPFKQNNRGCNMLQLTLPFVLQLQLPPRPPRPSQTKRLTKKREKVDFAYFNFHVSYVTELVTSFLSEKSIKINRDVLTEIARSIVVDIYFEYQRKHIQKTIIEKSYKRHLYRYLRPLLREIQLLN